MVIHSKMRAALDMVLLDGLTILYLEDHHDTRETMRIDLERQGATVHCSSGPFQGSPERIPGPARRPGWTIRGW